MENRIIKATLMLVLMALLPFTIQAEPLTVLYPDVKAPYNVIFEQIIDGILDEYQGKIILQKLPKKFNPQAVANDISTNKVIALGQRGMAVAKQMYQDKPVVVGALPIKPNGISGVSLMAAPSVLFDSLKELAPKVQVVTVLYSDSSEWIVEVAKQTAKEKGIIFNPIKVSNFKTAVQTYNELFKQDNLENMAIWLPLDPISANEKVIVPVILEKAWKNNMVVFSSKPTHAKRGALFSAMPDNKVLGKQLAKLVERFDYKVRPSTVKPLENIKLAVNMRTATHLGLRYDADDKAKFSLTFPNN